MASLRALLVGVDGHEPERFSEGDWIRPLSGAVSDALRMREFLVDGPPGVPEDRVRTLLSPSPYGGRPRPPEEDLPTLANLRRELEALGDGATPGDTALIHFSGHGTRVASTSPRRKREDTWDECLVPCDAGSAGFLHDWEIHRILHDLAERGLHLVVVLDCCHSAGAFRGDDTVRRLRPRGKAAPPLASEAGSGDQNDGIRLRNATPSAGWWPSPPGSVLLAACRSTELAREDNFRGVGTSGVLTHYLLEATGALGPTPTYRDLHRALLARIHGEFRSQTPVLEGDAELCFLGLDRWPGLEGVTVMASRRMTGTTWVHLATGLAQGVRAGARFSLHPPGAKRHEAIPTGEAEIVDVGGCASWARTDLDAGSQDMQGWTAVLVDPGPLAFVRRVVVRPPPNIGSEGLEAGEASAAGEVLDRVRSALEEGRRSWLEPASEEEADLGVTWVPSRGLVVIDREGEPLPMQGPANRDEEALLDCLCHLARFSNVRTLENPDRSSALRGALKLELVHLEPAWPGGPATETPVTPDGGIPCGHEVELRIENVSDLELQVAVLDIQPDWGISQVHPAAGGAVTLGPGCRTIAQLEVDLPFDAAHGRDLLKVVGTREPVDFSWLLLPALDGAGGARRWRSGRCPEGPLERLFEQLTADRPATRTARAVPKAGGDWTVAEVEMTVVRPEETRGD